ncbi:hypothetical protein K5V07_08580 [Flavobacterium sp. CHNK8]|uniref:hypothetical protein n=1 Tax=unclassified Flavobacterium TaxID=196869 RepID=UPI00131CBF4D|nr:MULTISPECIES: hypothetical protein [unclassified Flavobacterium]QZK90546.1 hypothetical protein K5V07_08580 [Flavobacterium sp. CHNK8]
MKKLIQIFILLLLISCKKDKNSTLDSEIFTLNKLEFSIEKVIIETVPELPKQENVHLVVKIYNPTQKLIKLPVNGIKYKEDELNEQSLFSIKTKHNKYSCASYLLKDKVDTMSVMPKNICYIFLSVIDNNIRNKKLENSILQYDLIDKSFHKKTEIDSKKISTLNLKHRLNLEEAIKLCHGTINRNKY